MSSMRVASPDRRRASLPHVPTSQEFRGPVRPSTHTRVCHPYHAHDAISIQHIPSQEHKTMIRRPKVEYAGHLSYRQEHLSHHVPDRSMEEPTAESRREHIKTEDREVRQIEHYSRPIGRSEFDDGLPSLADPDEKARKHEASLAETVAKLERRIAEQPDNPDLGKYLDLHRFLRRELAEVNRDYYACVALFEAEERYRNGDT
ncbi:hypothetical protein EVG20_g850 [Dentipellis fragilis]|uniref:Uncharacterized protein n=1 Tax=Dentipellis fragilis TaxID=205917 RepID=A0A4Y9ZFE9_9AGAM|nr:hypothetical protein EVG20_g850 [Dentipellis fragilis]